MATSPAPGRPDERAEDTQRSQETEAGPASRTATDVAEMGGTAATTAAAMGRELAAGGGTLTVGAPSTEFTSELNNIDFRKMIGGPLQAAVGAQVASFLATIDFIDKVGFTTKRGNGQPNPSVPRELVMADFSHTSTTQADV